MTDEEAYEQMMLEEFRGKLIAVAWILEEEQEPEGECVLVS